MIVRGQVENGVVILDEGVQLAEGQEVTVLALGTASALSPNGAPQPHSILDIPPVSVGAVVLPLTSDDDLLGEMLEGRA